MTDNASNSSEIAISVFHNAYAVDSPWPHI